MVRDSTCYVCEHLQPNGYCMYYCKYLGFKEYKGVCDGFEELVDSELLYTTKCNDIDNLITKFIEGKM